MSLIRFYDFCCRRVEVSCLKWCQMNNLIVFEKPLIIRSLLHEVKTDKKLRSVEKQAGFKLQMTSVRY